MCEIRRKEAAAAVGRYGASTQLGCSSDSVNEPGQRQIRSFSRLESERPLPLQPQWKDPITAMGPASILQMHPRVTCLMDEASASQLKRADYYRWVFEQKSDWQQPCCSATLVDRP